MSRRPPGAPEPRQEPELDMATLAEIASPLRFTKGTLLGTQGEPSSSLYVLRQGQVLMSRTNAEGESYALYLLGPGDLFGEGSLRPASRWMATIRAVTDGLAYTLPSSQVSRL